MTADAETQGGQARILADGNRMPLLGLGVWQVFITALEGYSPLGTGRHLADPSVTAIAASPAQVLLHWTVQRGIPVISKSTHRDRIQENLRIFGFQLPDEAVRQLDALDQTGGTGSPLERKWW
jgi:diketogulonate reductase-like aldo/keto reductase